MKYLITAMLFFFLVSMSAQEKSYELSVEQAVEFAIENNIGLNKSYIDEAIIKAQIAQVKGRALPQINANGRFTDNYSLAEQLLPAEVFGGEPGTTVGVTFGNKYSVTGGLDVQQQLLDFQLFNSLKSARALEELQNLQTLQTMEDLIINVVQVYIQIQVTEKQIELLQTNYDRTGSLIEISQAKFKEGIIKKLDVNQLIVNQTNLSTQIEDAQFTRQEQLRLLNLYLNVPMDTEIVLTETLEDRDLYPVQDGLTMDSNLQYKQMEQQMQLAIIDEKLVRAEYFPTLSAFFNYNYQGFSNEFEFSGDAYQDQFNGTWGLAMSIPVFDGFQRRKRLQQKQLETKKLEQDRKQLANSIEKDYADAREQLMLSDTQIKNQNINMELANENYEGIKMSYSDGVAALTELLDSEFALRQAQSNYLNALLQYRVAKLRLLKTSGQLSQLLATN